MNFMDILTTFVSIKNYIINRLSKRNSQVYVRRSQLGESKQDRAQNAERFLSYMDYSSPLFSLEDASYCVKFVTNSPDATSVEPPFCIESVEYDNTEATLKKFFELPGSRDKLPKESHANKIPSISNQNTLIKDNFYKNSNGFITYQPTCKCKRRIVYLQPNQFDLDSVNQMNLTDCDNGFVNETPFCICEPSPSSYFTQGTDYGTPKEPIEKLNIAMLQNFGADAIQNHIEKIFHLSIFQNDINGTIERMTSDNLLNKYEVVAPLPPGHFHLDCINPQYLGFFEYCTSNNPNNQFRMYHGVHIDLLQWDTEFNRRSASVDSDHSENVSEYSNFDNRKHSIHFNQEKNHRNTGVTRLSGDVKRIQIKKMNKNQCENLYRGRFAQHLNARPESVVDSTLKRIYCFEHIEYGNLLYRHKFYGKPHQNILIDDPTYGPLIISLQSKSIGERRCAPHSKPTTHQASYIHNKNIFKKKELIENSISIQSDTFDEEIQSKGQNIDNSLYLRHSIIVRSTNSISFRATLYEGFPKNVSIKKFLAPESNHNLEVLSYVLPTIDLSIGHVVTGSPKLEDEIVKLDETNLVKKFKIGILYCGKNQSTEEEIYNNREGSKNFSDFLRLIGSKVRLKGFSTSEHPRFHAQLDVNNDRTGTHSVYTRFFGREIMFHVCTMIPFNDSNSQQIDRKRHIGNDIVIVVFQESGALPLDPTTFHTHFTHVVVCVRHTHNDNYFVSVSRKRDVPYFGPPIVRLYKKDQLFREFLLTKIINAELASYKSKKLYIMSMRTRYQTLKNIVTTHSLPSIVKTEFSSPSTANHNLRSSASFSGCVKFTRKVQRLKAFQKKPKVYETVFPISPELFVYNGVSWTVEIRSERNIVATKCRMIIANQVIIFIDSFRKEPILTIEFSNIFFWKSTGGKRIDIYYKPKNILMVTCDSSMRDELPYILCRLRFFLKNVDTETIQFERYTNLLNDLYINRKGIVTHVNNKCIAYFSGLRNDTHILEIDYIPLICLSYEQFIDILMDHSRGGPVTLTVLSGIGVEKRLVSCEVHTPSTSMELDGINSDFERIDNVNSSMNMYDLNTNQNNSYPIYQPKRISIDIQESSPCSEDSSIKGQMKKLYEEKIDKDVYRNPNTSDTLDSSDIDNIFSKLEQSLNVTQLDSDDNWTYMKNSQRNFEIPTVLPQRNHSTSSHSSWRELNRMDSSSCPKISGIYKKSRNYGNIQNVNTQSIANKMRFAENKTTLSSCPELEFLEHDQYNNSQDDS